MITPEVDHIIELALIEDQVFGDVTTSSLIPNSLNARGILRAKTRGILAGVEVALAVFSKVDAKLKTTSLLSDGDRLDVGDCIAVICGSATGLLKGERLALNFLQRMSGVATITGEYVKAIEGYKARIADTRKTVPGWRYLDKYSVKTGGGLNHRVSLTDGILIKDNHIASLKQLGFSLYEIVRRAIEFGPENGKVEIEVRNLDELEQVVEAGAHIIMLDNMTIKDMQVAVEFVNGRSMLEASGGVDMDSVRAIASTGVDIISIGRLTHSAAALDINLDIDPG